MSIGIMNDIAEARGNLRELLEIFQRYDLDDPMFPSIHFERLMEQTYDALDEAVEQLEEDEN